MNYLGASNSSAGCLNLNDELWEYRGDYTTRISTMVIFAILYSVIILCGFVGNICVIIAITRNKVLQTVPNLFILSLSCSDIAVCSISATITPITAFKKEWIFGAVLCRIAPFIAGISLCFSTFTLTAISIDRYLLIRFPMKKPLTHFHATLVIGLTCVLAACISSPIIFRQKLGTFENFCGQYCTEDWSDNESQRKVYGAALLCVQLVVPLTIIIVSYTAISLRIGQNMILRSTKRDTSSSWNVQLTDQQRMALKRKQRTNRMLIAMVVAFSVSWMWSVTFNVLRDYDYLPQVIKDQEYLFGIATHCIAMTSTVWNPLLYAMLNLQLRAAFIELLPHAVRVKLRIGNDGTARLLNGSQPTAPPIPSMKYGSGDHHHQVYSAVLESAVFYCSTKRLIFALISSARSPDRTDFTEYFVSNHYELEALLGGARVHLYSRRLCEMQSHLRCLPSACGVDDIQPLPVIHVSTSISSKQRKAVGRANSVL